MTHSPDWPHLRRVAADARWHSELTELRDARQQLHARAEQTAHGIIAEHRAPRASEQRTLDALFRDINTIDELLRSAHDRLAADAPRRAEWTRIVNPDRDERRGGAAMNRRTDPELESIIRGASSTTIDISELIEKRSLNTGTGSAGKNLVPIGFRPQLWLQLVERSPLLSAGATVLNTTDGGPLDLPRVDTYGTAAGVLEGSAIPSSDPTFALDRLSSFKYGKITQASRELVQDSGIDLAGFLAREFAVSIDRAVGPAWSAGTGTTEPRGVVWSAGTAHTGGTGTGGAPTTDDLLDTFYGLGREYRREAVWLMSDSAARAVRKIKTDDGQPLWQPALTAGEPDRLLGRPVLIDPYMETLGTNSLSIAVGDPATFLIRIVGGVQIDRSDDFAFNSDLISWRAVLRTDSVLHDPAGFVLFKGGTA